MVLVMCIAFSTSNAGLITWDAAQDTTASAANDIVNGGAVVHAYNGHQFTDGHARVPEAVTLDGVAFTVPSRSVFLGKAFNDLNRALGGNTTGDAGYDSILNNAGIVDVATASDVTGTNANAVYSISGLSVDTEYFIQVWYAEERGGNLAGRKMIYGDGNGNTVTVAGQGANGFGQFVVGTFVADAATQDLQLIADGMGRSHVTGLMVREVPEPATMMLLSLGGILLRRKVA